MNQINLYFQKGVLLAKEGKNQEAIDQFSKIIELDDSISKVYLNRGLLYQRVGDENKAQLDFISAAELGNERAEQFIKNLDTELESGSRSTRNENNIKKSSSQNNTEKISDGNAYSLLLLFLFGWMIEVYTLELNFSTEFIILIWILFIGIELTIAIIDGNKIEKNYSSKKTKWLLVALVFLPPLYFYLRQSIIKNSYAPVYICLLMMLPGVIMFSIYFASYLAYTQ